MLRAQLGIFMSAFGLLATTLIPGVIQVGRPVILGLSAGVAEIGSTVSVLFRGETPTSSIQWLLDDVPIAGATGVELTVPANNGAALSVSVQSETSQPSTIRYPAPISAGALQDQTFPVGSGVQTVDVSGDFTFAGTPAYSVQTGPAGVTVEANSGLVQINTDAVPVASGQSVVIRLADAGDGTRHASSGFSLTIAATVPSAFAASDWSLTDAGTGNTADLTIAALPASSSTITAIQYRINGDPWTDLGATDPGSYTLTGFTDGVASAVVLWAVNVAGPGAEGPSKMVTTSAGNWTPPLITDVSDGQVFLVPGSNPQPEPAAPSIAGVGDGSVTLDAA